MFDILFGPYIRLFRKHPALFTLILAFGVLLYGYVGYLVFPNQLSNVWPFSAFEVRPSLRISLLPSEEYEVGQSILLLQRIDISNSRRELSNITIRIKLPLTVSSVKVISEPNVPCSIATTQSELSAAVLVLVSCDRFVAGQRTTIMLVSDERLRKTENFEVEVIGKYGKNKITGTSVAGRIGPEAGAP